MKIELTSRIAVSAEQISRALDDEFIILHLSKGSYYGMGDVAGRIWELIQQPAEVRHVLAVLLEEYDVAPEVCQRDLLALLQELADQGLIDIRSSNP